MDSENTTEAVDSLGTTVSGAIYHLAEAIIPDGATFEDATGESVSSLTEGVLGVGQALQNIVEAIDRLTRAIQERSE